MNPLRISFRIIKSSNFEYEFIMVLLCFLLIMHLNSLVSYTFISKSVII